MAAPMHDWWPAVDEWVDAYPGAQAERGQVYAWLCDAPERAAVDVGRVGRYEHLGDGMWSDPWADVQTTARALAEMHQPQRAVVVSASNVAGPVTPAQNMEWVGSHADPHLPVVGCETQAQAARRALDDGAVEHLRRVFGERLVAS